MRRLFQFLLLLGAVILVAQIVPYGRGHGNPKTVQEIRWNSPATRTLATAACMDCHSNLTLWPWYTKVAPLSWLTAHDVETGRAKLNFSEWQRPQEVDLQEVMKVIREKEMPPLQYKLIHAGARLSDNARQQLEAGISASWIADPPGS